MAAMGFEEPKKWLQNAKLMKPFLDKVGEEAGKGELTTGSFQALALLAAHGNARAITMLKSVAPKTEEEAQIREMLERKGGVIPPALHSFYNRFIVSPNQKFIPAYERKTIRLEAVLERAEISETTNRAEAAAVALSLIQSCRSLKINHRDYLEDIMRRLLDHPANKLSELLPGNWVKPKK